MRLIVTNAHRFSRGDVVLFSPGAMDGGAPMGSYRVLVCLPDDGIGFRYAVQSTEDSHERVVREHRLTLAVPMPEALVRSP